MSVNNLRLIQFFIGDGGCETSAALGTVMRASGYDLRTCILFFLDGKRRLDEYKALIKLDNVDYEVFGRNGLLGPKDIKVSDLESGRKALETTNKVIMSGDFDLVVLDEVSTAVAWEIIQSANVLQIVKKKPANVELILTGRYDLNELIDISDLVTKIVSYETANEQT